jgi:hypothetical protein
MWHWLAHVLSFIGYLILITMIVLLLVYFGASGDTIGSFITSVM